MIATKNTKISYAALLGTALFALGACGSSSSTTSSAAPIQSPPTTSPVQPPPTTPPVQPPQTGTFEELKTLASNMFNEQAGFSRTPQANMPVTGTATYSGAAAFRKNSEMDDALDSSDYVNLIKYNPTMVSEVQLTATFAPGFGQIQGQFYNFQSAGTGQIDGQASFSEEYNATTRTFNGAVEGGIDSSDVSGTVIGEFLGDDAEHIQGSIDLQFGGNEFVGRYTAKQ
jgi:hypothetical protein